MDNSQRFMNNYHCLSVDNTFDFEKYSISKEHIPLMKKYFSEQMKEIDNITNAEIIESLNTVELDIDVLNISEPSFVCFPDDCYYCT